MTSALDTANVYTDFQGLDQLRMSADKHDPKALEAVAKQFEALFIQQMLKSMREASLAQGAFDSNEGKLYIDMFDKQISLVMAQGKGLGLADMMVKQLRSATHKVEDIHNKQVSSSEEPLNAAQQPITNPAKTILSDPVLTTVHHSPVSSSQLQGVEENKTLSTSSSSESSLSKSSLSKDTPFASPESFVHKLWPYAQQTAQQIGVSPAVLLAQAALETGWGKNITKHSDGRSSYNLFNIKSNDNWSGDEVSKGTLEYKDGVAVRETAQFRSYPSYADSFRDYANLLQSNPRYYDALQQASDPVQFTQALQQAGYATDPEYSNKIIGIVNGLPMQQALENVKLSAGESINNKDGSQL